MGYQEIAIEIDKLLRPDAGAREIERAAAALFKFRREQFQNPNIKSARAQMMYDWLVTLGKQRMDPDERSGVLVEFCRKIGMPRNRTQVDRILSQNGVALTILSKEARQLFEGRSYHPEIVKRCQQAFIEGRYFLAVFEAARAYNSLVKQKAHLPKDGPSLMLDAWERERGALKVAPMSPETDRNLQEGIRQFSAGLMQALGNPTAPLPHVDWSLTIEDTLDLLSFVSFLLRKADEAVSFRF